MQEKNHAGQEAVDSARDLVVLKLQDMYEVVTRDMMSDSMRSVFFSSSQLCFLCIQEDLSEEYSHLQVLDSLNTYSNAVASEFGQR